MSKANVVWWWKGGRCEGQWMECAISPAGADATVGTLNRAGYVAHPGSREMGRPEGPPAEADFRAIKM